MSTPHDDELRPLLPEEEAVGSDDATEQVRAVLEESEERVADPEAGIGDHRDTHEHRRSEETV